ncbi:helix-turn-helix domain-containing protein [Nocardia vulneris]|uniref:XRE family transcriptional regulator n=1 Tax=Nocardia vulneris TaxID=1141657 RepID=A0ABR4Z7X1_9NOCA|nr:XRE family transcriptional regulator [Nocardia vulneris]
MQFARRRAAETTFVDSSVREGGPVVLRLAVGGQLRRWREGCGITKEAAGEYIRSSNAKISRLELGRAGFKERDLMDLLTLYGVTDSDQRATILDLARKANQPGWWHRYSDLLPSGFETYIGLESAAQTIRTFEGQLVPGLLQTEDYARAVIAVAHDNASATPQVEQRSHGREIDVRTARRVELRSKRQEILDAAGGPILWAVLDEAVLHRPVGGTRVMREQLEHLVAMSTKRNVIIQVLTCRSGGHAAVGCSFTMLGFAEREVPEIVYLEHLTAALYLDRQEDVETYRAAMNQLVLQADTPEQSRARLIAAAAQM